MTEPPDTIVEQPGGFTPTRDGTNPGEVPEAGSTPPDSEQPLASFVDLLTKLPQSTKTTAVGSEHPSGQPRYTSMRHLGAGGMGTVILAHDRDIGRNVAIKRIHRSHEQALAIRFAREVQALGQLDHPGIVPIHDVGRNADGSFFVVMKHIDGDTLEMVIERLQAGDTIYWEHFDFSRRLQICQALVETLCFAHEQGFIHRDIKPSNIMIGRHGQVTLIDWGLAKPHDPSETDENEPLSTRSTLDVTIADSRPSATRVGSRLGTPLYMSPEQAAGRSADIGPQSDLYSLAVVCYELLSLTHYLDETLSVPELLVAVQVQDAKLAYWQSHAYEERMPIEFAYWIKRAMAKDLQTRFASAEEMRSGLEEAISGSYDIVCPTTLARRLFRTAGDFANQRPLTTILAALGAVGTVIANIAYLVTTLL